MDLQIERPRARQRRGHGTGDVAPMRDQSTPKPRRTRDPWDRFWEKVIESAEPSPAGRTGCWLWTSAVSGSGYGAFGMGGRAGQMYVAHKIAYEWVVGVVPDGLELDHLCRDTRCVNPAHLEPVTHRENLLRGEGWSARHARKTHCPAGHVLAGENLSRHELQHGQRKCLTCHATRERTRKARLRAERDRSLTTAGGSAPPLPERVCGRVSPAPPTNWRSLA
jgi:hypothetical protein